MTTQFKVGKMYYTRSIGDADCVISQLIVKRTDKTVTVETGVEKHKTFRIKIWNGVETFKPWGSYSMAPTISADKVRS